MTRVNLAGLNTTKLKQLNTTKIKHLNTTKLKHLYTIILKHINYYMKHLHTTETPAHYFTKTPTNN